MSDFVGSVEVPFWGIVVWHGMVYVFINAVQEPLLRRHRYHQVSVG
jgi:hypothetical protein